MTNLLDGLKNLPPNQVECAETMSNMVSLTLQLLTLGHDEQKLKEIWVGIGIEIDTMNAETLKVLQA